MSRILVIHDDAGACLVLRSRLVEQGHEVVAAEGGSQGVVLAREGGFDLCLVSADLQAGVDGFEVCRRLKSVPEGMGIPAVIFSDHAPPTEVLARGYAAGCDAFVTRPELPGLEHVIRGLLRQRGLLQDLHRQLRQALEEIRRLQLPALAPKAGDGRREQPADAAGREFAPPRPDGLIIVDGEGIVRHADRGASELLGGRIEGRNLGSLAPASGLEAFVRDARFEAREGFRFDLSARRGSTSRPLIASVVPLVVHLGQHDPGPKVLLLHDAAKHRLAAESQAGAEPGIPRQELGPLLEAARETFRPETLIGTSPAILDLRRALLTACGCSEPVLIVGESGTGKERLARTLHFCGPSTGAFLGIRANARTEEEFATTLLGCARAGGSKTESARTGLFHHAQDGTLYLEEVGELPLSIQDRLLEYLASSTITRVGGRKAERVDVRLIASTSVPLEELVEQGRFRRRLQELFAASTLRMPPLRDRLEDVAPLARYYVTWFGSFRGVEDLEEEALEHLQRHDWPGNVAELVDCLEQACLKTTTRRVRVEDLPRPIQELQRPASKDRLIPVPRPDAPAAGGTHSVLEPVREVQPRPPPARESQPWDITDDDPVSLEHYEKKVLLRALHCSRGDKIAAAKLLKVGKSTLYRKLKRFEIE